MNKAFKSFIVFIMFLLGIRLCGLQPYGMRDIVAQQVEQAITSFVEQHKKMHQLNQAIKSLAYSPDGKYLAVATVAADLNSGAIRVLDTKSNTQIHLLTGHTRAINALEFNPLSPEYLVSVSGDKTVKTWNMKTGENISSLLLGRSPLNALAFNPIDPNQIFVGSADKKIYMVDMHKQRVIKEFSGHTDQVMAVSVNQSGTQLLSGSYDRSIRIWNIANGQEIKKFLGRQKNPIKLPRGISEQARLQLKRDFAALPEDCPVTSVMFNPFNDNEFISGGWSKELILWNIDGAHKVINPRVPNYFPHPIAVVRYNNDGSIIAVGSEYETRIDEHLASTAVQVEPLCKGMPGTIDVPLQAWLIPGYFRVKLPGQKSTVNAVAFDPITGKLASGSTGGEIIIWDILEIKRETDKLFSQYAKIKPR